MTLPVLKMEPFEIPLPESMRGVRFPFALRCTHAGAGLFEALDWVREHRPRLEAAMDEAGAVLLRGLPVRTADDFDAVVAALGVDAFGYHESLSNAVRLHRTPRVFTANESPPTFTIHLHHELAQTPVYPGKILFFCERPAERGGATSLCRSDLLYERLREAAPAFLDRCEQTGLRYTTVMPDADDATSGVGRSWRSTFAVTTRDDAEARMTALGYSWQWSADGTLRATTPALVAVRALDGRRKAFFNQLIAATAGWRDSRNDPSKAVTHGDGTPLDPAGVRTATELAERLTVDLPWQASDIALVDNHAVMHGRRTFEGKRSVLVALGRGAQPATMRAPA